VTEPLIGSIQLDRTVDSILVGTRHRADLGDIDALAASIGRDGLLQPLTITIDGVLVCGARRLAAIKKLGWRTVNVWVRSGLSDRLGQLLAEQDDNMLHKPYTQLEAAGLYREIKQVMAEDAARRKSATQFSSENQPGNDGSAKFAGPSSALGDAREQAAAMIPGGASHTTLEKIGYLEDVANNPNQPETLRAEAAAREQKEREERIAREAAERAVARGLGHLGEGRDDEQVAHAGAACGRAVHRDHAAAALALDGVGDEAFAVVDVPDVNLFVFADVGGVEQVFVDGAGAFVVQFALRGGHAVDLGLEQGAVHGGAFQWLTGGTRMVGAAGAARSG